MKGNHRMRRLDIPLYDRRLAFLEIPENLTAADYEIIVEYLATFKDCLICEPEDRKAGGQ